jgi:hypothetical protein
LLPDFPAFPTGDGALLPVILPALVIEFPAPNDQSLISKGLVDVVDLLEFVDDFLSSAAAISMAARSITTTIRKRMT